MTFAPTPPARRRRKAEKQQEAHRIRTIVTKIELDTAGSVPSRSSVSGTSTPAKPAIRC
jgi:hypothetical protein